MKLPFFMVLLASATLLFAQKKDIAVSSANVQTIYRNCANLLTFDVPELCGQSYNAYVEATDATVTKSKESNRKFLVAPRGDKCKVDVYDEQEGGRLWLGDWRCKVIEPPAPQYQYFLNGAEAKNGAIVSRGSIFTVKIVPDAAFADGYPQDARYVIEDVSFYTAGCFSITRLGGFSIESYDPTVGISVPFPTGGLASGEKVFVEIGRLYRVNYAGKKIEDGRLSLYTRTASFFTR